MNSSETRAPTGKSWFGADHRVIWFFFLALVTRLVFLFLADNNGVDAGARYRIALSVLQYPIQLPDDKWLPLHFWLMAAALWVWTSVWSARLLTVLLGALTILPFWGIVRRAFDEDVAFYSTLMFALFGFHIAYSVTTSSEGPTIFFLVLAFYAWLRLRFGDGRRWLFLSGLAFSAAALCRYEAWAYVPVLAFLLLDFSGGWRTAWSNRRAWGHALAFAISASAGAAGWLIINWVKWGAPFSWTNRYTLLASEVLYPLPLIYRVVVVPGALGVTLSPLIAGLAIVGIFGILARFESRPLPTAVLATILAHVNLYNSIYHDLTMARFTLMYSWLWIPLAFHGMRLLSSRWPWLGREKAFIAVIVFVFCWEGATIAGAYYGPPVVIDKCSVVVPTLPLSYELRKVTQWLKAHAAPGDAVVVDEYNFEAGFVTRYSGIPSPQAFLAPHGGDYSVIERELRDFIQRMHPRFLVYCPRGTLGKVWRLDHVQDVELSGLNLRLRPVWQGNDYRIYEIEH